ncbi:hypothetical protein ZOSMA_32G00740 [Zostera marina]|uniref:Uncharacterized protein n=1 Tax=Zostera marina TaxID=29655 RepID=A0A0K9P8I8_ZOSMR|nr:hypothetical protein ZOSMA_32G00740 [Zostera marina]
MYRCSVRKEVKFTFGIATVPTSDFYRIEMEPQQASSDFKSDE